MSIRLIVNADDYGQTAGVSAGIRGSHRQGIVTSTTTMMNMPDAEDALRRAVVECPDLGLGVHLVLTCASPLLPASRVSSLIDEQHHFYGEAAFIARLKAVNPAEVEAEWRTQIDRFVSIVGHAPDHLDAHHHVSYFSPELFKVMLELAQDYGSAIRLPVGETAADIISDFSKEQASHTLEQFPLLLQAYHPRHPDRFIKSFYDDTATQEVLSHILANLSDGVTEIMCHPAHVDPELLNVSIYTHQREVEFGLLTQPSLLKTIEDSGIELVNFGQLS